MEPSRFHRSIGGLGGAGDNDVYTVSRDSALGRHRRGLGALRLGRCGDLYYHAGVGLLFLFVGYARLETTIVRQMVRGLGVLLVAVKGVTILVSWLLPTPYFLHGPVEITCLVLGIASILAARYLPDQRSRRYGRGVS